jgi:hypothetical protein
MDSNSIAKSEDTFGYHTHKLVPHGRRQGSVSFGEMSSTLLMQENGERQVFIHPLTV